MGISLEDSVKKFYDGHGWKGGEDALFRQFRPAYQPYQYHAKTEARTLECFKGRSGLFLIAGEGDLPQSHLDIANKFSNVTCVDISQIALDIAEQRLPSAQKLLGSICALPEHYSDQFDCAFASHVIYHIEANQQSKAVRELIRACKPGGRIVILYSNPASPIRFAAGAVHRLRKIIVPEKAVQEAGLYFSPHPLRWWKQFENDCDISMKPWDVIGSYEERTLIWGDLLASGFYRTANILENISPNLAVKIWQYPIVILDKR